MSFLQKTALNLVKCGLHRPSYYLHPHIGGSHSVLYFTIEKYSNSNVLMVTSSLQMTTPVDETTIEGTMTEGTQTEETTGRIATIPGQGTD